MIICYPAAKIYQQDELSPLTKSMFLGRTASFSRSTVPSPSIGVSGLSFCLAASESSYPCPITETELPGIWRPYLNAPSLPVQHFSFRLSCAAPGAKPFRIRTYTKRGRGWGSEKSGYISPETLTLPTRLTADFGRGQKCNRSGSTGVTSAYTVAPSFGNCILNSITAGGWS
jgi:hypothetical protein